MRVRTQLIPGGLTWRRSLCKSLSESRGWLVQAAAQHQYSGSINSSHVIGKRPGQRRIGNCAVFLGTLQVPGNMMNAEYFHVIASRAVDGNVVFMNDELTCSMHSSCPPHAGEAIELFCTLAQFFDKRTGSWRIILRDVLSDFVDRTKRCFCPFKRHVLQKRR